MVFFFCPFFVIESPLVNLIWVSSHLQNDQTFNLNFNKTLVPSGKIEYCYIFWTLSLPASDGQYCCGAAQLLSGDGTLNPLARKERESVWMETGRGKQSLYTFPFGYPASEPSAERNLSNGSHLKGNLIVLWGESLLSFPVTNSKQEMDRETGCGTLITPAYKRLPVSRRPWDARNLQLRRRNENTQQDTQYAH